jgi:diacylglycerol O-acyltransferase / wax synthase
LKQLTGLDATFLYMETAKQFGHVSGLSILAKPTPNYEPLSAWRAQVESRLHLLEPLRRKLVMVPLGLDHPMWIEDPDFDLDYHVRHTGVPPPGTDEQLGDVIARIIGRPLDRNRPLWESYVIEGLDGDRFAILTKVHHATVDGASGAELLTMMMDQTEAGDPVAPPETPWQPEPRPTDLEVLARVLPGLVRKPGRAVLVTARTMRQLGQATRNPIMAEAGRALRASLRGPLGTVLNLGRNRPDDNPLPRLPTLSAPKTPFNGEITAHRRFAFRSTSLDTVKQVKNAVGATVNDVVMAVCAGGIRTWLERHGELPEAPLVAMIPVSIRTGEEVEKWTNRVSGLAAVLPTDLDDPLERVKAVHEAMVGAKELWNALPAESLTDFAQFPPPAVFAQATRLVTRMGRQSPVFNLVISNVPGPRQPLYMAGARLMHYFPVSTITDGQGLNITVQSYLDTLDFGLVSCRELVPDLWDLLDDIIDDLDLLAKAAGI